MAEAKEPITARRVAAGVWQIVVPTPFPVGPVNTYLIAGPEPVLVDTGPRTPGAREAVIAGLAAAGLGLAQVRRIVITHNHIDHYGLAGTLCAEAGAQVWAHRDSVHWLTGFAEQWEHHVGFVVRLARRMGVPGPVTEQMRAELRRAARFASAAPVGGTLAEGDRLAAPDGDWTVYATPGHARGHICLLRQRDGVMIAGDHLIRHITPCPVVEPPPSGRRRRPALIAYLRSLRRVAGLPITLALPGHGVLIDDVPALVRSQLEAHERRRANLRRLLTDGWRTPYELGQVLFPEAPASEQLLVLSEVLGHLEVLQAAGVVQRTLDRGRLRFALSPVRA